MKIMYALVFFVVVITSASSVLSVSLNNNNDENQDIVMVVDDATSLRDAEKAQNGKFFLEDGKVLTLARKLSPFGFTCVDNYVDRCGGLYRCCGDLVCTDPYRYCCFSFNLGYCFNLAIASLINSNNSWKFTQGTHACAQARSAPSDKDPVGVDDEEEYICQGLCPLDPARGCLPLDPATMGVAPGPPDSEASPLNDNHNNVIQACTPHNPDLLNIYHDYTLVN
nr:hypothetical protein [Tanacetum cinerariifolium]